MSDAGTQKTQPVYFGNDKDRVICTLAMGDDINRIPTSSQQNACADITALKPVAGQRGVLNWTERIQM